MVLPNTFIGSILFTALIATAVATAVSIVSILVYASGAWFLIAFVSGLDAPFPAWRWLWSCVILIAPVTLASLPAVALIGSRHLSGRSALLFPALGLAGGYIVAKLWAIARDNHLEIIDVAKNSIFFELPSYGGHYFILVNALAGLSAGLIFALCMQTMPLLRAHDRAKHE